MVGDILYTKGKLSRREMPVSVVIQEGQKLILEGHVASDWKLIEEVEALDLYTLRFSFHKFVKKDNVLNNRSYYHVQKNDNGKPVLIRISE